MRNKASLTQAMAETKDKKTASDINITSVEEKKVIISVTPEMHYRLKKLALEKGTNIKTLGNEALNDNTEATDNTSIGYQSGDKITTGTTNTVIGSSAASSGTNDLTTGSNNTVIGYNAEATSASVDNQITLGNASVTNFRVPGVGLDVDTNRASITGYAKVSEYYASTAPVVKTADFTLADTENWVINNKSGTDCVVTLPSGSEYIGRAITFQNHANHKIVSASSNVIGHTGGAAQTDICKAVAGTFATIVYDGTSWYVMATNA